MTVSRVKSSVSQTEAEDNLSFGGPNEYQATLSSLDFGAVTVGSNEIDGLRAG